MQTVGYARTTARAVVEASGTNLGSIAYHYGTIDNLRDEALIEASARWLAPIIANATSARPGAASLEKNLDAFLKSLPRHRQLVVAFLEAVAQADRKPALRRRLAASYSELRSALAIAMGPAGIESEAAASLVLAVCDGLMLQWAIDPPSAGARRTLVAQIRPALKRLRDAD